jgi:hypothetical protein
MRIPLLPEPGARRVYGFVTLVNTFGFGLIAGLFQDSYMTLLDYVR